MRSSHTSGPSKSTTHSILWNASLSIQIPLYWAFVVLISINQRGKYSGECIYLGTMMTLIFQDSYGAFLLWLLRFIIT